MAILGFIDWKGNPINKQKHGGVRAACFIYFLVVMSSIPNVANMITLVTYVHVVMHTGVTSSSTIITNFIGASRAFALLGAFLSDSYITRFRTILIFGPLEFLGLGLLALQAHLPSLRPPWCDTTGQWTNCERVHGLNSALFYIALYTVALGEGCMRACMLSLGADQFDANDPVESQQRCSFFNWFGFGISLGAFCALLLIVWIQTNKGWDIGFAVCAFGVLLGLLVLFSGLPFYRNQIPRGSPLTRILQVFIAAFRKRKLSLPENIEEVKQEDSEKNMVNMEVLPHTKGFEFLDKAAIYHGSTGAWSYCSVTQVEETKIILRMLPIFIASIIGYIPVPLLMTFSIQQGGTMNTRLGKIHISPANLMLIPVTFEMVFLIVYDQLVMPFARKFTGYVGGITNLQRAGIGYAVMPVALTVAALVEKRRKHAAEQNGLQKYDTGVPMSVMWLSVQFFIIGIYNVTSFVGLLEFFNSEISRGMKSIGAAIFWCMLGLSSLLGSFAVNAVNKATRHGENGTSGWLEGANLNESHLDRFYWLLSVIGFFAFSNYLFWAKRYFYRHNPRVIAS